MCCPNLSQPAFHILVHTYAELIGYSNYLYIYKFMGCCYALLEKTHALTRPHTLS